MTYLSNIPTKDLEIELTNRKNQKGSEEIQKSKDHLNLILKHRNVLRQFLQHDRTSCAIAVNNAYHPEHGGADCCLCCLDDLDENSIDVDIVVSIKLSKI